MDTLFQAYERDGVTCEDTASGECQLWFGYYTLEIYTSSFPFPRYPQPLRIFQPCRTLEIKWSLLRSHKHPRYFCGSYPIEPYPRAALCLEVLFTIVCGLVPSVPTHATRRRCLLASGVRECVWEAGARHPVLASPRWPLC